MAACDSWCGVASAASRTASAFLVARRLSATAALVTFVAALAVVDAERRSPEANIVSLGDSVWSALSTMTTVGYGDRYPTSGGGWLVAVGLMLVGLELLSLVTATLASWFVEKLRAVEKAEEQSASELAAVACDEWPFRGVRCGCERSRSIAVAHTAWIVGSLR